MSGPAYPPPAPSEDHFRSTPEPPGSVQAAFWIYLLTALLSLVGVVVALTGKTYDKAIIDAASVGSFPDAMSAQQVITLARTVSIVVGMVFLLLFLFCALMMRAGRSWARIVLTVLSVLSILTVSSTGSVKVNNRTYSSAMSLISGWVGAALAVLAIVFMFMAASNAYFRAAGAARKSR